MRRRYWVGAGAGVAVLLIVAIPAVTPTPPSLTLAETDAFWGELRAFPSIVHRSPTDLVHWRRRCSAALHAPSARHHAAVDQIVALARDRPQHRLVIDPHGPPLSVRDVVLRYADDLVECRRRVTSIPAAWVDVERRLRTSASAG